MVNNTARVEGGGIFFERSTITSEVSGDISFIANFANNEGGGIYAEFSSMNFTGNVTFNRNFALVYGGGIYARGSKVYLLGSTFCFNYAVLAGGSIYSGNTTVSITAKNLLLLILQELMEGQCVCMHLLLISVVPILPSETTLRIKVVAYT